jgi:hypothetical protein
MAMHIQLPARFARRLSDPVFVGAPAIDRHIFYVAVRDLSKFRDIPLDPNARVPNVNKRVYRDVEKSLMGFDDGQPGTFHLKNKGITIVASQVAKAGDDLYDIAIDEGQGILDGGHTHALISAERDEELPENQYVKVEVLTGVPQDWIPEIAGGLNTAVQVQQMSLDNLSNLFDWIKDELRAEPYFAEIAWKENESGEFDARDLVSLMTLFNIWEFPNRGDSQPVMAYEKKSKALELFEQTPENYKRLRPILKDILTLHDVIRRDSRRFWNESGGKFGGFAFVETKKRGEYSFPFAGNVGKARLMNGALYPMLASFRWMVEEDSDTGLAKWKGGFDSVLKRWEASAEELMRMTAQANTELGRNPNAIGKSRNHWANLHARVAMRDLMAHAEG